MSADRALILVTTSFPIAEDGSEAAGSFVADLAEELSIHMPVRVVAPGREGSVESWSSRVQVFRFAAPAQALSTLKPWRPRELQAILAVLKGGAQATERAVQAGPAAHILALWALPSGHWARLAVRNTGLSYSIWTLGSDIWSLGRIPLLSNYLRRVLRDAHTCYSDGIQLAEDTRRIGGCAVEFLPSTRRIQKERSVPLREAPPYRLLFLGRWHFNKGVDLLIDALKLLSDQDWRLIDTVELCGGGPLESLVRAGVGSLQRAGRPVSLRGYLDKKAAEDAILRADYLLIPSRIESIPLVFSDALKLACPVIASPVGDLPELVGHLSTGIVADAVDAKSFGRAIAQAMRLPPATYAAALSSAVERFSLEGVASAIASRHASSSHES